MSRTFLSFTEMDKNLGAAYVEAHRDEITAAGGSLDMIVQDGHTILRLKLPSIIETHPDEILKEQRWVEVQEQTVPVQRTDFDIDEEERQHGGIE